MLLRLISISYPYQGCRLPIAAARGLAGLAVVLMIGAAPGRTQSSATTATVVPRTIRGRVTNALSGAVVPRVLVTINSRAVLTDSQGNFLFAEFTDANASVRLTKPGYSQSVANTLAQNAQRLIDLDAFQELKIFPDAVISVVVTGRDGQPLSRVNLSLRRQIYQSGNGLRWVTTKGAPTDLHGECRFVEPPGRYQVSLGYVATQRETGEAMLPVTYPEPTGSDGLDYFAVMPGQELHIDLRPRSSALYPVAVHVELADQQRQGLQFSATTTAGDLIQGVAARQLGSGDYQLSMPIGTFTLHARMTNRDSEMQGAAKISVTGPRTEPIPIHMEAAASLPVELAIDPASAASATVLATSTTSATQIPDLRQFNLRLRSLTSSNTSQNQPDAVLRQRQDKTYEFLVPPGRYRLESANGGMAWYVESATYGVANLLTSEIVIASGGGGVPIRIVANNDYGKVTGTVALPADVGLAWVYMVPAAPSLAIVNPIGISSTGAGASTATFSMRLPAGSYLAIALDRQVEDDVRNPEVLAKFSTAAKTLAISASGTATVDLTVSPLKESNP